MCRRPRDGRNQRGSTLLLFPAGLLIMVALAAMAVDSAIGFMAQRELMNATAAAANDAATQALSDSSFYEDNRIELNAAVVESIAVDRVFAVIDTGRHHGLTVTAEAVPPSGAGCPWTVRVAASSTVDELFGKAMPGSSGTISVSARSSAAPREAASGC